MIAPSSTTRRRRPQKSYAKEIAAFKRLREFVERLDALRDTVKELDEVRGRSIGLHYVGTALEQLRADINATATDALLGEWP